jgi:hemoglobin/transferrin/lactoferrin receptor protein
MKIRLSYSIMMLLLYTSIAYSQITMVGKVIDEYSNEGVEKAKITITPSDKTVYTSVDGSFRIDGNNNAPLTITAERIGYEPYSMSISEAEMEEIISQRKNDNGFIRHSVVIFLTPSDIQSGTIDIYEGRIETELKYATLPVSIVTDNDIKGMPFIAIPNAIEMETGVNLLRDGIWANDISVRGLSRDNVITLIDGNRIETSNNHAGRLALIDLNTVERIELVKGGTSSIYGSGAMGGIINIVTKSGMFSERPIVSGSLTGMYSLANELASGSFSIQFSMPELYLNTYLLTRNASDMETPRGAIPNSSFRDYGIHLDGGLKLSKNSLLKAAFENFNTPFAGIPGGYPVFPTLSRTTYLNAERTMADVTYELSRISKTLNKFSLHGYYQKIDRDVEVIPNTVVNIPSSGNTPARRVYNISIYPSGYNNVGGLMLQADLLLGRSSRLVAGIDTWLRKLKTERERTQIIQTLDTLNNVVSSAELVTADVPVPESQYLSSGLFVQNQTSFMNERLYLDVSGRLDAIFISNEETISPLYTISNGVINYHPAGQKVIWEEGQENDLSWSLGGGMNYRLDNEWNINGNISASYRSPGLEERYQYIDLGNIVRLGNPALRSERGYFTSAGLKYWGSQLNMSIDVFGNFLSDLVIEVPGTYEGRQALVKQNVGSARIAGADLDLEYSILPKLIFLGGGSYVNGTNTEDDTPLPQIAPLNFRLGLKYQTPFNLRINLNSAIYSEQNETAAGESVTPGYAVFNLYMNYSLPVFSNSSAMISAGIENIFDKDYRNHLSTSRGVVTSEPGRNYFLNISLKYK